MTDLIAEAAHWQTQQLETHATHPVLYERAGASALVPAACDRTTTTITDSYGGYSVLHTDRAYLIPRARLILDGNLITPEPGDLIHDGPETYIVTANGPNPHWHHPDAHAHWYRVECKRKSPTP
jgi:hypothetical protein